jgi:predicted N-acetyltransferase YhbS
VTGPRFPQPHEFDSMFRLCALCFAKGDVNKMVAQWPHIFDDKKALLKNSVVFEDKGKIVSYVGIWPATMVIAGKKMKIAGITYVGTHPKYRGKGLMSKGLEYAISIMHKRGFALSWLIGDRHRYGNFGWENAARKYYFSITGRSVKSLPPIISKIKEYKGDGKSLAFFRHTYSKREIRLERNDIVSRRVFSRLGKTTFLALHYGKPTSYLTVGKRWWMKDELIGYEYGGNPSGLGDLISHAIDVFKVKSLLISSPVCADPCLPVLFQASSMWKLDTCFTEFSTAGHMVLILDLLAVLRGFVYQMNQKRNSLGATGKGSVTLTIKGTNQYATIQFGKRVSVTDKQANRGLVLSERDMVRLLFGVTKPSDSFKCPTLLDSVLPLDFFISPLEDI